MRLLPIPFVWCLMLLAGCGSTPRQYETRIDGASAHTSDHQSTKGTANSLTTKITITPATTQSAPALAPAPLTVQKMILSPPPATANIVNVSEVPAAPAPQPVHVNVGGRHIDAPAGSAVTLEIQDVGAPSETHRDREAEGLGASIRSDSKDMTAGFNAGSPDVKLAPVSGIGQSGGGGAADGGDTAANVVTKLGEAISAASKGATAMWVIAVLCFLAAVGVTLFDVIIKKSFNFLLVGILAGVGILFVGLALVIEQHPELLILGVLAAVGGFVFYLYHRQAVTAATKPAAPTTAAAQTATPAAPTAAPATAAPTPAETNFLAELKTEIESIIAPKSKA